jgi:hypothetical protein
MEDKDPILALASPVRGEARYLLEWIAYHRALGVRAFFLGDNGGDDGTSDVLADLHQRKIVFCFDWRGQTHFQLQFIAQAIQAARLFADGLFLLDVDEFLRPQSGSSVLPIARRWLADATIGAVALNMVIYGTSGREQAGDGLVIERFTTRAPQDYAIHRHAKPFVRVASCAGPADNPHAVKLLSGRYVNPRGEDVVWDTRRFHTGVMQDVVWDVLRVDHFLLKSREEFAAKRARGMGLLSPERDWDRYFELNDRNEVEDPISSELVERTKAEMAKIAAQIALRAGVIPAASPASQ